MISQMQYRSKIQSEKVNFGDDANNDDLKLVFDILKEANGDVLFEIFLRLPNCRSAILFGSVCRYWHSLISRPQFIPRFISHRLEHQYRYSLAYTIIFRKADRIGLGLDNYSYNRPICKLFSEESLFLHGKSASTSYLDFLPCPMVTRASCNDLLLVYPGARAYLGQKWSSDDLYICNPTTKQYYKLPEFPRPSGWYSVTGHALVCMPTELGLPTNHFKVVEFYDLGPYAEEPLTSLVMSIFCSKSGKWGRECFHWPQPNSDRSLDYVLAKELEETVTCNGIAYWLENKGDVDRVIALDLLHSKCGAIVFPDDFWWFREQQDSHMREQIGAVCGELRLLQVVLTDEESIVDLKLWKFNYNKDWVLVHDKKNLKRPSNEEEFIAAFVHPTNGDVIFMVWDMNVFQYNLIMEDTYEMIGVIEDSINLKHECYQPDQYGDNERLVSYPMVHPAWPTPLPSV